MAEDSYIKQVLDHIIDIKEDIGGLNQSYITLSEQVCKNTKKIENTELMMSRWLGGISVLAVVINIAAYYFFN